MTIANGGNIGIGTSSPLERITFGSSDSIIARSSDTTFNSGYCSRILFNQGGTGYGYLGFYTYQGGTGGGERMRITESGNVGIGITVPGGKLHVVGSSYISASANTTNIKFEGGGGNGLAFGTIDATSTYASWIQSGYVLNFVLATYNLLLQPLGGNVGIGTTSPSDGLLSLNGTYPQLNINNPSTGSGVVIQLRDNGRAAGAIGHFTSTNYLQFSTAGQTPQITLMDTGNVGIGTTNPGALLAVNGNAHYAAEITIKGSAAGSLGNSSGLRLWQDSSVDTSYIYNYYSGPMVFGTTNTERMRILSGGNVGIGTSSPEQKLHVRGYQVYLYNDLDTNNTYFYARNSGAGNAGIKMKNVDGEWTIIANDRLRFIDDDASLERLSILSDGNVGIGTTSPVAKLDVAGNSKLGSSI
jgi:hypothetical protein